MRSHVIRPCCRWQPIRQANRALCPAARQLLARVTSVSLGMSEARPDNRPNLSRNSDELVHDLGMLPL